MSDHSTGSSGSSTNSWTILSPEEAAVETLGPDDGTESLSGVPGLPEEGTGVPMEGDITETHTPAEQVLTEEGHQVCQETSPEVCEAAAFVGPSFSGFVEGEFDPEIHAPVIHDTITSSPPDSDLLGSTPFTITSESALLFSEEPTVVPPTSQMFADVGYGHEIPTDELHPLESRTSEVLSEEKSPSPEAIPEPSHTPEPVSQQSPSPEALLAESPAVSEVEASAPETLVPDSSAPEVPAKSSPTPDISSPAAPATEILTQGSPTSDPLQTERTPTPEHIRAEVTTDVSFVTPDTPTPGPAPTPVEEASAPEAVEDLSQSMQGNAPSSEAGFAEGGLEPLRLEPETIASASVQPHEEEGEEEEEYEEEPASESGEADVVEKQDVEPVEAVPVEEVVRAEPGAEGGGLRQRHVLPPEPPMGRSSEDEDEEEEEFQLAERREEKKGFGLNKLIVAALVLLCLGSLFFSDDGFDGSEMTEQELLERLAQENQQIAMLEAQLQSQKEALDQALRAAVEQGEAGGGAMQKENIKLKEELAAVPGLKEELESLRARVAELSQLTVQESETSPSTTDTVMPPADQPESANQIPAGPESQQGVAEEQAAGGEDGLKAELQRQKSLLEDSRKRLEIMKKSAGKKKGVREGLVEMQKRLSEQAERLYKRHDWKRKQQLQQQQQRENLAKKDQGKKWAGKKEQENQWSGKKEQKEDKSHKLSGQWESKKEHIGHKNGKKEHGDKWEGKKDHGKHKHHEDSEKWREQKEWKHGKNGKDGRNGKDDKESKQHAWRKYHEDWDGRKHERKMEREKRKSERPWEAKSLKKSSSHHDHHHHHQTHHHHQEDHSDERSSEHKHTQVDFWKHQEQKLRRNPGPTRACSGVTQCAEAEGLVAVELVEFQALLESYLSKLPASTDESKEELQRLTSDFFPDGVFDHERLLFSDFAEDVADILEDLADVLDNDSLEEEMEEFEREALWKFAAAA